MSVVGAGFKVFGVRDADLSVENRKNLPITCGSAGLLGNGIQCVMCVFATPHDCHSLETTLATTIASAVAS
jgi:hypothetical protein